MRIGIDGRSLRPPQTGVGRYVAELCQELDPLLPEADFFVYSHRPVELALPSPRWRVRLDPWPGARYLKNVVWMKLRLGRQCAQDHLDVFWSNDVFLPRLPARCRGIGVVHDLNYYLFPAAMNPWVLWAHRLYFRSDLHRAAAIIAVSRGTQARLRAQTGVEARVVPAAAGRRFRRVEEQEGVGVTRGKYGLDQPYVLCVATREPRKNLEVSIEAFRSWRRQQPRPYELALVGAQGWKQQGLDERIDKLQAEGVRALGFVPDEDLPALYSGCSCFLFPSIYEGFGSPVAEARACGAPIVTSDIPELHESGGAGAVYVEPTVAGVVRGLEQAVGQRNGGAAPAAGYQESAKILAALFREIATGLRATAL